LEAAVRANAITLTKINTIARMAASNSQSNG
jgi:hypothetical protein